MNVRTQDCHTPTPCEVTENRLSPLYRVLMHDDDKSTMEFVVSVIMRVFGFDKTKATEVMWTVHTKGVALVVIEPYERAEFHRDQCHSIARGQGFPLTVTIEPCE